MPPKTMTARMTRTIAPAVLITSASLPDDAIGMAGAAHGSVVSDESLAVEFVEGIVHERHPLFAPGLNSVFELVQLVFADEVADCAVGENEFVGEDAARAVGGG